MESRLPGGGQQLRCCFCPPAALGLLGLLIGIVGIGLYLYFTRRASKYVVVTGKGYRPKIMTPPKAILIPSAVEALGARGAGTTTEVWWSAHHPFKSGLTGQNAQQFCDAYTAATGKQWTQPIGFKHANLEVALDALKRAKKLDAAVIRDAVADTNYQSLVGPLSWKGGGPTNPVKNVCTTPLVGGQWKPGTKFKYDLHIVYNQTAPASRPCST